MSDRDVAGMRCSDVLDLAGGFVLGALTPDEDAAVRAHVSDCPEAHAEVAELGSVLPALFESVEQVEAPAGLKERIMAAAAAEQAAMGAGAPQSSDRASAPAQPGNDMPAPRDIRPEADTGRTLEPYPAADTQRRSWDIAGLFRRPAWAAVAAAAVVAVLALGALNLQLQGRLDGLTAYRDGVVEVLEQAARPGAQLAVLSAPPDGGPGPTGLAAVGADGRVAMVMRDLAPTTGTQVYEAWLIGAEGTPIPVGSFRVDASRTAAFSTAYPSLGPGVTVALSIEPQAGATTPTTVVALGTAQGEAS